MKRFEDWANDLADKIAAKEESSPPRSALDDLKFVPAPDGPYRYEAEGEDKKMSISYAPWESVVTKHEYSTKDLFESLRPVQKVYASYIRRTYGEERFKECVAWLSRYNTGETPKNEALEMDVLVNDFECLSPEQKHEFMTRVAGDPVASMAKTYSLMTPKQKFAFLKGIGAHACATHYPDILMVEAIAYFKREDLEN